LICGDVQEKHRREVMIIYYRGKRKAHIYQELPYEPIASKICTGINDIDAITTEKW